MSHLSFVIESSSETSSLWELILKNGLSQNVSSESVKNVISHPPHVIWNVIRLPLDCSQVLFEKSPKSTVGRIQAVYVCAGLSQPSHKIENRMWKENYKCGNFICLSCISFIFWGTQHVRKLTDSAEQHMVLTSHFSAGTCNIEYANLFNFSVRYGDPKAPWPRIFPSFETWSLRRTTAERDLMKFFFGKTENANFYFTFPFFFCRLICMDDYREQMQRENCKRNLRLSSSLPLSTAMRWMQTVNETHNHWVVTLQLLDMALHTHSLCILWETSERLKYPPKPKKRVKNNKVQIMRKKQFLTFFIIDDVKCTHNIIKS